LQTSNGTTLKSLTVPGGVLLLAVAVLAHTGWLTLAVPSLTFLNHCALAGSMLLAWRFHSSRVFLALLVLFLAYESTSMLNPAHAAAGAPELIVWPMICALVPLNFVVISLMEERGFTTSAIAPVGLFLFAQCMTVAVTYRALEPATRGPVHHYTVVSWPSYLWFVLAGAAIFLALRAVMTRKPADVALFWSLSAATLSSYFVGTARISSAYAAIASAILGVSIIENSYLLAYHDELTTLPSRRAFNDALLGLQPPFAIAVVDIDYFKRFNDTYGHETGDQVLRLVAGNLSRVTGGGQAYRYGGEEFAILFPAKSVSEVVVHLERLRERIQTSEFHFRNPDRRQARRGPDRRQDRPRKRGKAGDAIRRLTQNRSPALVSVTVSIGVASSSAEKPYPDLVLEAADKALYRAKDAGRNRVEAAPSARRREDARAAGIA
jgi:diguanylate cyclase (GGDEF)-like protein